MPDRRLLRPLAPLLALAVLLAAFGAALATAPTGPPLPDGARVLKTETLGDATRLIFAPDTAPADVAPAISFIDSPTAACYQPDPAQNICYINWYYQYVDAGASNYMITMTTSIGGRLRAYNSGFFQQTMYVPFGMHSPGFKVTCGAPGASGDPQTGLSYSYEIRARASDTLGSANYGTARCPFYQP
jgi:hypothetical protein